MENAFAVWLTGRPAAGKSAIARALGAQLHARGVDAAVLESDVLRTQFTPYAGYDDRERDMFYACLVDTGVALIAHGVPVIFDATANRRSWRERARARIARFAEVFVDCPLAVCETRDPKGLYRRAKEGSAPNLPGLQAAYEPPAAPELVVRGDAGVPEESAREIVRLLEGRGWIGAAG